MLDATEEPEDRTLVLNGVAVPSEELEADRDLYPNHEGRVVDALRRHVHRGDRVVVVGGGWGVTAVVAARMTHFEGAVTVYEPSEKMLGYLRRAVEVNRVADLVTVEHAAVGSVSDTSERIFGDPSGDVVAPTALPECDVLDLDCEGAELEILRDLRFRPRLLTVEAHPHLGCPVDEVVTELEAMGYDIVDREPIRPGNDIENVVALRE
ncbi:FkbM family methyltransferase [Haloarchaeobius baliensis]|uniref:FkbM family methyltransferase n=1 Tax=Haloarchaeobius baliensis TaxID=1670458 RepID=UPI003F881D7B